MHTPTTRPGPFAFILTALLLIAGCAFVPGCAIIGGEKVLNPKSDSPVHVQIVTQTPTTLPQVTSAQPTITITGIPSLGSRDPVRGSVGGVEPADYKVVVYVFVDKWYGPKPTWENPLTPINRDGTWSCNIMIAKTDEAATRVAAYVVPNGITPARLDGAPELPAEMAVYMNTVADRK